MHIKRKRRAIAAVAVLVAAGTALASSASANLPGSTFEGGDGNFVVNTAGNTDWAALNAAQQAALSVKADLLSGQTDNSFGNGTKTSDVNVTVVSGSIPNNKADLGNSYITSETLANGDVMMYLGVTRVTTSGTVNLDIEVNQAAQPDLTTPGPKVLNRTVGDLLISYDFQGGSQRPTLTFRTWTGSDWSDPTAIGAANGESEVNRVPLANPLAVPPSPANAPAFTFGEASINLTGLGIIAPGESAPFSSAYVKSRASSSFTSAVKDFIAPQAIALDNCGSITIRKVTENGDASFGYTTTGGLSPATFNLSNGGFRTYDPVETGNYSVTEATIPAGWTLKSLNCTVTGTGTTATPSGATVNITMAVGGNVDCTYTNHTNLSPTITTTLSATAPVAIGTAVHDSATLTGATANAGGTVTYTVYTNNTCTNVLTGAGTKTVTNGVVPDSNGVTFNNAGTFYWQAAYSGDANNQPATSVCQSEIVVVNQNAPSIATTLSATSVAIGATVTDSATLTGATATAGGTVTYTVYTNNTCTNVLTGAGTKTVTNGVVPDSNGVTFNNAGTFYWQAAYSGDANNNPATSVCQSEIVVVNQNAPSIATTLSATSVAIGATVTDSATLTGATATAGGTVTYTVYTNNTCTNVLTGAGTKTVTNGVVPDSNGVTFNNAGTFYWQAAYSGDANNQPATSVCLSEVVVVTPNAPAITTMLSATSVAIGATVTDSATLTTATSDAGGTVTYTVYTNATCTNVFADAGTKTVTNGVVPDSNGVTFNDAGTFYWQAAYSGDANNQPATDACLSEIVVVNQNAPSITTMLSATSVAIGTTVHDSATLTDATATAGGTVTYTVYTNATCTNVFADAGTKTVTNGVVPDSNGVTFNDAGTFYWQAAYSGDANNQSATSACLSEIVVVNPNAPTMTTAQNLLPNDDATISGATLNAGGTIEFSLFAPDHPTCAEAPAFSQTVNVSGNGKYSTTNSSFLASAEGTWRWLVSYSGDANNDPATSECGVEHFTIAND